MTTKIGSFDLGVKHLAFVVVEINTGNINVLHSSLESPSDIVEYMDNLRVFLDNCNVILIERQMNINRKAFALQHQMITYLKVIYRDSKTCLVYSSKKKTELLGAEKNLTYPQRKRFTVNYATDNNVQFIDGKKKDDIADAYCQAIAYIKENKLV